jgi:hypothetical protein
MELLCGTYSEFASIANMIWYPLMVYVSSHAWRSKISWRLGRGHAKIFTFLFACDIFLYCCIAAVIGLAMSADTLYAVMKRIHLVPFPLKIIYNQRPRL